MADENLFADSSTAEQTETQASDTQETEQETAAGSEEVQEESTASEESESVKTDESEASSEDAEQSGQKEEVRNKPSKAERRIKQLLAKTKALEEELGKRPAPQQQAEQQPLVEPTEPNLEEYETIEKYNVALKDFKVKYGEFVAEKAKRETVEAERKAKQEAEAKQMNSEILKREARTLQRIPEYNRNEAVSTVQPDGVMADFFARSDVGPDVLWELHEDPDEAERIRNLPFWEKVDALFELRNDLRARIKGIKSASKKKVTPDYVEDKGANPPKQKPLEDLLYG